MISIGALNEYNMSFIELNGRCEIYIYEQNEINIYRFEKEKSKGEMRKFSELDALSKSESIRNRIRYRKNLIADIKRIVDINYTKNTNFLTLTFAEEITDHDYANNELKKFFKRLIYHVRKNIKEDFILKYLWVWEYQEKRAEKTGKNIIHYHLLLFDCPFIDIHEIVKIWGNGICFINNLGKLDDSRNVGRYIVKYFSKAWNDMSEYEFEEIIKDKKVRLWGKTNNLKKPKKIEMNLAENSKQNLIEQLRDKAVYTNEYTKFIDNSKVEYFIYDGDIKDLL